MPETATDLKYMVMGICYIRFVLCCRLVHKFFVIGIDQHYWKLEVRCPSYEAEQMFLVHKFTNATLWLRIWGRTKALATVEMILEQTLVENLRTFEGFPNKRTILGHMKADVATYIQFLGKPASYIKKYHTSIYALLFCVTGSSL